MSVNLSAPDPKTIFPVQGVELGTACAGIRKAGRRDVMVMRFCRGAKAAGVFTQNRFAAAPVRICREHQTMTREIRALVVNTGVANAGTGEAGLNDARLTTQKLAALAGCPVEETLVFSTGVIMEPLPMQRLLPGLDAAWGDLSGQHWLEAAQAIMTTDTVEKQVAYRFTIGDKECTIGAIGKGVGMINPNMATMLIFITTDVAITPAMLQKALSADVKDSFNMVSVDGDTSTNDMACVLANGLAENALIAESGKDFTVFRKALNKVTTYLCRKIAKDGEGATKLLECKVSGAKSKAVARTVAKSVIKSSLFKAAMFGADANWGRVLCAIGYAGAAVDISKIDVDFKSKAGVLEVCRGGSGIDFSEEEAKKILSEDEIEVLIRLNDGNGKATAWGCDLTYEYVKINGDYRT